MNCKFAIKCIRIGAIAIALPVLGANAADESATQRTALTRQTADTQHIDFAPGGAIHIDGSYGILRIEGWDRPEVAVTITKSLPYGSERTHPGKAKQRMEALRVVAE